MEGWPEWLSVVPEPAARSSLRWSEMSSALATYSERALLVIASRYRSMARFMLVTSRLQVRGGVDPSSKKDLGTLVVAGTLYVVLVKDVADAMLGACAPLAYPSAYASLLFRRPGEVPFIESMDVEGDKTALKEPRLLRGLKETRGETRVSYHTRKVMRVYST